MYYIAANENPLMVRGSIAGFHLLTILITDLAAVTNSKALFLHILTCKDLYRRRL